jgi:hypothetical protein
MAMSGVVPVLDVSVTDTTGAGDAFLAGTCTASFTHNLLASRRQFVRAACWHSCRPPSSAFAPSTAPSPACAPASAPALDPSSDLVPALPCPAGFLFYMLLSGGLDSLVADPSKVTALLCIRFAQHPLCPASAF